MRGRGLLVAGLAWLVACGSHPRGDEPDAAVDIADSAVDGASDGAEDDAASPDAASPDAASPDAASPDAANIDAACIESTDASTFDADPSFLSSDPVDFASAVSVLVDPSVRFSLDLDPAFVTPANVSLRRADARWTVPADLTYDAGSRAVRLSPYAALDWGASYVYTLANLRAAGGTALPTITIHFSTYRNPIARETFYTNGQIVQWKGYVDLCASTSRVVTYSFRGTDDTWFTTDDVITSYVVYTYDAAGHVLRDTGYSAPGPGNTWFDGNDVVSGYNIYDYDADGDLVRRTWYFANNTIGGYDEHTMPDALGIPTRWITHTNAGADGQWFTTDDPISYGFAMTSDAFGRVATSTYRNQPGTDNMWFTDDDPVLAPGRSWYDDGGGDASRTEQYAARGTDGMWFTTDDVIGSWSGATSTAGIRTRWTNYSGAGMDGQWRTTDDVISSHVDYSAFAAKDLATHVDGFGANNAPNGSRVVAFDANGNRTTEDILDANGMRTRFLDYDSTR